MTKIFSNPGSTEVSFLVDLPSDLEFVLALHEGSVVGIATGYALGRGEPSFVLLHTTPGLGNAVSALATSRVNRAPLVVVVGQQDRRHLAHEPFLAGKLAGLAGEYPVWVDQPVRPQDVPGALERAWHEAQTRRGPALVIVPMDDWNAPAPEPYEYAAPDRLLRAAGADEAAVEELAQLLEGARSPALVAGAGADDPATWEALVALAERLARPGLAGAVRRPGGLPADAPALRGRPLRRPRQAPRGAGPVRRRPRRRRSRLPPVRLRRGPVRRGRDDGRGRHRGPRRGAAQPRAARRARAARRRSAPRSPSACRSATPSRPRLASRPSRPRRTTRCAPGTSSTSWPRGCPENAIVLEEAPVEPARAARPPPGPPEHGPDQPRDGRARLRDAGRDRPAPGAARRVPWSRSSATARRSTRSSRSGARRPTSRARCS